MRIIESSQPALQLLDTQPAEPITSTPINSSSSFQPLATTLPIKDVQSCQVDATNDNDNDNEIEQPPRSELETRFQLFKNNYPDFLGNSKEFEISVAMAYDEMRAGKVFHVDKYISSIPRWRMLAQKYPKGHYYFNGLVRTQMTGTMRWLPPIRCTG
jgi:hypothetical protein